MKALEAIALVELGGIRFRIDDQTDASKLGHHFLCKLYCETKKCLSTAAACCRGINREARDPENGHRIRWRFLARGQVVGIERARRDGDETEDTFGLDSYIGYAEVMTKLILACELLEEAVDVAVAGAERRSVIRRPKRPDFRGDIANGPSPAGPNIRRAAVECGL